MQISLTVSLVGLTELLKSVDVFSAHINFRHYFLKLISRFIVSLYFWPPVSCIKDILILNQAYWSFSVCFFLSTIFVLQRETSVIRANKLIFQILHFLGSRILFMQSYFSNKISFIMNIFPFWPMSTFTITTLQFLFISSGNWVISVWVSIDCVCAYGWCSRMMLMSDAHEGTVVAHPCSQPWRTGKERIPSPIAGLALWQDPFSKANRCMHKKNGPHCFCFLSYSVKL